MTPHLLWYQSMIASARSTAQLVDTTRQGVTVLGPDTPAGACLENVARFLDFVTESLTRAAEQAREGPLHQTRNPRAQRPVIRSPAAFPGSSAELVLGDRAMPASPNRTASLDRKFMRGHGKE
jgi:hypothetical protein